jgi:hypothetical protein
MHDGAVTGLVPTGRGVRTGVLWVVFAVLAAAALSSAAYRIRYGTFAWWEPPSRIDWCNRRYLESTGPLMTIDQVRHRSTVSFPARQPRLETVTHVPPVIGHDVMTRVEPTSVLASRGAPCAMVLFLQTGDDTYREYGISGGP